MQFHIVTEANTHAFPDELDQFFYERHRVYAEELGWVEASPDRRERDAFDTEHAVYLIGMDAGQLIGGSRLVPTDRPHLVSEVFPDIFTRKPIVRAPDVMEWTRGFLIPERREGGGLSLKAKFCAAVMEYCLAAGVRQIGGIQDAGWLRIWARMGWTVHIHGDPIDIGGEQWLPAYFDVNDAALEGARKWARVSGPLLDRIDLERVA